MPESWTLFLETVGQKMSEKKRYAIFSVYVSKFIYEYDTTSVLGTPI